MFDYVLRIFHLQDKFGSQLSEIKINNNCQKANSEVVIPCLYTKNLNCIK